jgi:dinuclear metal center YbgI/SA1388 family protein
MSPYTVRDLQRVLERLAPGSLAESWDNVGLLVGDPDQRVSGVLVALDATPHVLEQLEHSRGEALVVHHPLIFSGLKRLTEDQGVASLVMRLIRGGRSLLVAHTNLDSAPEGLNHFVADCLGLLDTRPLLPSENRPLLKFVVYVPLAYVDAVRDAICQAGAGQIGNYAECTFGVQGIGTFRPGAGADPFIGQQGALERVEEVRLETVVPRPQVGAVINAMRTSHPYEEVAYDLMPLEYAWPGAGLGRIGTLAAPLTVAQFAARVQEVLRPSRFGIVGDPARPVRTVALCTGSGGDLLEQAWRAGADLYLTGEVKHHQALLARQRGIALLDAGHFATERPAVSLLARVLREQFPELMVREADEHDPFATGC